MPKKQVIIIIITRKLETDNYYPFSTYHLIVIFCYYWIVVTPHKSLSNLYLRL